MLDAGCGIGDLYGYLVRRGRQDVRYVGVDVLPGMVEAARERYPGVDFRVADVLSPDAPAGPFDYVFCSGTLNVVVEGSHRDWVKDMIRALWQRTGRALALNALAEGLREPPIGAIGREYIRLLYPQWLAALCRQLTARLVVREDVLPGEVAIHCFRSSSPVLARWAEATQASPVDRAMALLEHRLPKEVLEALGPPSDDAAAENLRAVALLQLGETSAARRLLRALLEAHPDHGDVHRNYAAALAMDGDLPGAADEWRRVLEGEPDDDQSRAALVAVLLRLSDKPGAEAEIAAVRDDFLRSELERLLG